MKNPSWLEQLISDYEDDPEYVAETLVVGLNEQVVSRMQALGLRRTDLAERMGVSKPYITKILRGNPNLTLRTIAALALALETRPLIGLHAYREVDELVDSLRFRHSVVIPSHDAQEELENVTASAAAA